MLAQWQHRGHLAHVQTINLPLSLSFFFVRNQPLYCPYSSSAIHLNSNILKYYYNLKYLLFCEYVFKCNLFLWCQSWIFRIITPVFCVTWSFINHSNMLICCSGNIVFTICYIYLFICVCVCVRMCVSVCVCVCAFLWQMRTWICIMTQVWHRYYKVKVTFQDISPCLYFSECV